MIQLKGGQVSKDIRLDRLVQYDERSRQFPIRKLLRADQTKPRSYTWGLDNYLKQGAGACTGFGTAHELRCRPCVVSKVDEALANKIYDRARQLDDWPGEDYEGSSVLAAVKAAMEMGFYGSYHWAFGIDEVLLALSYKGPVITGINWTQDMFNPDANGFIYPTGGDAGGHCIVINSLSLKRKAVRLPQTWGRDWGVGGDCYMTLDALEDRLKNQGEACIPQNRVNPA